MSRPGNRPARTVAEGAPEAKTPNGWNDAEPLRRLIDRIIDIRLRPERHAHPDRASLEACCSPNGAPMRFLRSVHERYVGHAEVDPRYADGQSPGGPPVRAATIDDAYARWLERNLDRLLHIVEHPREHDHFGMDELNACCSIDGRFDWALLVAHWMHATLGHNPMEACDALEGPCACGAWHRWGEPR